MTARILVVDDEPRMLKSLRLLFEANDYHVETASSGEEALSLLTNKRFDVAVIDIHLPDTLGTELLSDTKAINPDTTVIMMTGEANLDSAIIALKLGAYDYLRKPFEFEELLKTVENAVIQKRLHREKEQINHQLFESERKYRQLVHNSPDIIFTIDADGNFTFISEAVERLLGFKAAKLIGKHYSTIVCEEDREKVRYYFTERRTSKRTNIGVELCLIKLSSFKRKNHVPLKLNVELKSMGMYETLSRNGKKKHLGTQGIIRDISQRKQLQMQIQSAERVEAMGTIAGGVAHNFNNLLMAIQGYSTLISMDLKPGHPHWAHLDAINECIQRGSDLTNEMLNLARGGKCEFKPIKVNRLIEKSTHIFEATNKMITIEKQLSDEDPVVEADHRQLEQVFLNLFVNAGHAMPEGGTLRLETKVVHLDKSMSELHQLIPGSYVLFSVSDNGIGMDRKTLNRIFDPFFSTKKNKGTGLGLSSAYGIVKSHNGSITAHSHKGKGSTFRLYFPIARKPVERKQATQKDVIRGSETLLIVDDEELFLYIGKELLEKLGYSVIAVNSGEKAVATIRHMGASIDLVILDLVMPGMNGNKTFDAIMEICPELPVLLSSGYGAGEKVDEVIQRGCKGFIKKPFTFSEISQKVRRILDASKTSVDQ